MRTRFRIVLPATFGFVAASLVAWDLHNQRVIESMGMAWDTGAPFWPYEVSYLLLSTINAPAFVLAAPFFFLPDLQLTTERYPVLLPAILLWWWWAGTRIDFGILGGRHYRYPRLSAGLAALIGIGLLFVGATTVVDGVRHWIEYPQALPVVLTKWAGLALWAFTLAGGSLLAANQLLRREFPAPTKQRRRSLIPIYAYGLMALAAVATSVVNGDNLP